MTVGIARLTSTLNMQPYSVELEQQETTYYKPLILNYQMLTLEYGVLRNYVTRIYHDKTITLEEKQDSLRATLFLAQWLAFIYQHYLLEPSEVARLENDQRLYHTLLQENNSNPSKLIGNQKPLNLSQQLRINLFQPVRIKTREVNPLRLTFIRSKRVLDSLVPIIKNLELFRRVMTFINKIVNPILAYVAWLFFLPRLMVNLFHLVTHTICHPWMSKREKELGFLTRFTAQLQQRWFEIGNDLVWSIAGVLACFVWVGPLAPIGIYINVALYAYDVLLMGIRVAIDVWRLRGLQHSYQLMAQNADNYAQRTQAQRMQEQLHLKIIFDYKKLAVALSTTIALLVAIVICMPSFAFSPFIPFVGACLLLAVTLMNYGANKYLDKHEPKSNLQSLVTDNDNHKPSQAKSPFTFFKPSKTPSALNLASQAPDNIEQSPNQCYDG